MQNYFISREKDSAETDAYEVEVPLRISPEVCTFEQVKGFSSYPLYDWFR